MNLIRLILMRYRLLLARLCFKVSGYFAMLGKRLTGT
jgi:hypothetical protein